MSDHLKARNQEAKVHGIAPEKSIDMTSYSGSDIPGDWEIDGVTGDILMVEYADTVDDGEEVIRQGIIMPKNVSHKVWRVGVIRKVGPGASEQAAIGKYVMFPSDKGIPCSQFEGKEYIFLNEQRIFAYVKPKGS